MARPASEPRSTFSLSLHRYTDYQQVVDFRLPGVAVLGVDERPPLGNGWGPSPAHVLGRMIGQMVRQGMKLYATEGTAAMIERAGMPVQMVTKRIGRGKPDILNVILRGIVDGVINTPGPADKEILDGLEIRRAAVERGIPCITSIDTS